MHEPGGQVEWLLERSRAVCQHRNRCCHVKVWHILFGTWCVPLLGCGGCEEGACLWCCFGRGATRLVTAHLAEIPHMREACVSLRHCPLDLAVGQCPSVGAAELHELSPAVPVGELSRRHPRLLVFLYNVRIWDGIKCHRCRHQWEVQGLQGGSVGFRAEPAGWLLPYKGEVKIGGQSTRRRQASSARQGAATTLVRHKLRLKLKRSRPQVDEGAPRSA